MEATAKQLRIKTSAVKRLGKEVTHYEKEAADHETKLKAMQAEGKDQYDIRAQQRLLEESMVMIPDSKRRYEVALEDLTALVEEYEAEEELAEKIAEARAVLPNCAEA
mmetsp:Transcript_41153/g.129004  ORF Transcript_41153/g.129004 Transcript_41153/m.129004 type:complete len:108 (-) Transcript_41153:94-417(-)